MLLHIYTTYIHYTIEFYRVKELFPVFTSALLTNSHPKMIIMFKSRKNSISMSKFNFIVTENRCNIINVDVAGSNNQGNNFNSV